jgi:aspartate 1-decarboxylase
MLRRMFLSKIHRAVVTEADLDYEGSVTIDQDLMDAAGMLDFEEVHLWNITRGTRLVTYAIPGERASGTLCVNGAAAHLARPGDLVIVATFGELTEEEARRHEPRVIRVDGKNRIVGTEPERPGPDRPRPLPTSTSR